MGRAAACFDVSYAEHEDVGSLIATGARRSRSKRTRRLRRVRLVRACVCVRAPTRGLIERRGGDGRVTVHHVRAIRMLYHLYIYHPTHVMQLGWLVCQSLFMIRTQ